MRTKLLVLTCGIVILFNVNQSSAEHLSPPLSKLCEAADGEAFGSSSSDAPGTDPETQKVQPSPARSAEDIALSGQLKDLIASKLQQYVTRATPEIARLKGRRFVAINETAENDMLNETRVKYITSQDTIAARHLHKEFFDFDPTHKTFITTNHKPVVHGTDVGIWRRIHLIPFTIALDKIGKIERDFRERRLLPELSGILNWAIEGAVIYNRDGLNPPATVLAATEDYRKDMDVVGQWLTDRCERDPHAAVPTRTAYADYVLWAEGEIGWVLKPLKFRRNLTDRGFKAAKGTGGQRLIQGLKLKPSMTAMSVAGGLAQGRS